MIFGGIGDAIGDFLGSESISGSGGDVKVQTRDVLNELQKQLLNQVLLSFLLDIDLTDLEADIPGISAAEEGTVGGLEQILGQVLSGENVSQVAGGTLTDILTRDATDIDEFFETNVADPLFQQFEEDILPGIEGRFGGQFFGGERRETEARAREDLIDALARGRADVALRGREFDTASQLQAAGLAPGVGRAPSELLLALQGGLSLPRGIKKEQLAAQSERLRQILAALNVKEFENIAAGVPGQTGLLPGLFSGFGSGFAEGLGGFLFD